MPFSWQSLNIIGGSPDVRAWPETAAITALKFSATGLGVDFTKLDTWPDVTPPGWDGPIEYTIWVAEQIGGQWYATGALELWRSDLENGGNPFDADQIRKNWVFQASPMNAHTVVPGETIGIFVTSGGQRGGDVHQITERSNIVFVSFPSGPKTFTFTQLGPAPVDVVPAPAPVPASVPVPAPVPAPAPDPVITDSPLDVQLAQVHDQIAALQTTVNMLLGFVAEVPKVDPAPIIAALKALRFQATNKLLGTITLTEIG